MDASEMESSAKGLELEKLITEIFRAKGYDVLARGEMLRLIDDKHEGG